MILTALRKLSAARSGHTAVGHPRDPALAKLFGMNGQTTAGVNVDSDSALGLPAVWACVGLIGETLASLPLPTYRRVSDKKREKATNHPVYRLLHDQPNEYQTSFEYREMVAHHLLLRGNAYSVKVYDRGGNLVALDPLHPDMVTPFLSGKRLWYRWQPNDGAPVTYSDDEILHFKGRPKSKILGMNPIEVLRNNLGLTTAAEMYGSVFFANGAAPLGVLEHPGELGVEGMDNLRYSWEKIHKGVERSSRIAILEEGMKYTQLGLTNADAQFIETRKLGAEDVCRIFNVPPPMIGILDRATYSNTEQTALIFEKHCVRPWTVRQEQVYKTDLFGVESNLYAEHDMSGLLRGDLKARTEHYKEMWMIGAYSQNDILSHENEEPVEGGDRRYVPLNMVPVDRLDEAFSAKSSDTPPSPDDDDDDGADEGEGDDEGEEKSERSKEIRSAAESRVIQRRKNLRHQYRGLFQDAASRLVHKESNGVASAIKRQLEQRGLQDFLEFLTDYYRQLEGTAESVYRPIVMSYVEAVYRDLASDYDADVNLPDDIRAHADELLNGVLGRHIASSREQLRHIVEHADPEQLAEQLRKRLASWEEKRAESIAERESTQIGEAAAVAAYATFGVQALRWTTIGDTCPICLSLAGVVVGTRQTFLNAGQTIAADGVPDFTTRRAVRHPPLHKSCDCMILPG